MTLQSTIDALLVWKLGPAVATQERSHNATACAAALPREFTEWLAALDQGITVAYEGGARGPAKNMYSPIPFG